MYICQKAIKFIYETKWKLEEKGIPFFEIFKLYFNGMSERYFVIGLPLITGLVAAIIIYAVYRKRAPENEKERNKMQIKNKICRKSRLKLSRR